MGLDLLKDKGDGNYELIESINPKVKRDIYLEKWLNAGDYVIYPKSSKLNHFIDNPFNDN